MPCLLTSPPQTPLFAAASLLALREAITNWDAFAVAAGLRGWDSSLPPCQWSGVTCSDDGRVRSL